MRINFDTVPESGRFIEAALSEVGYDAYVVGGFVRDSLLGLHPHDVDIATNASPEDVVSLFEGHNVKRLAPSQSYPVVIVNGVQVATFRQDVATELGEGQDWRKTQVKSVADYKTDAARRDFTVNALYLNYEGEVLDPTGLGLYDLQARLIRFVGDPKERLKEDPLRALRAVRFAARLGFVLELKTRLALYEQAKR